MNRSKDRGLKKERSRRKAIRRRRRRKERPFDMGGHPERQGRAAFALISAEPGEMAAGLELVLKSGTRIRIGRGVDAATLRTVLATVDREPC